MALNVWSKAVVVRLLIMAFPHTGMQDWRRIEFLHREVFMRSLKKLFLVAGLALATALNAQTLGNTSTFSGLLWFVSTSTPGLQGCTELILDATGDVGRSANYAMYGQVYCPSLGGSYASSGNAYFDALNGFHMTVSIGVTYQLVCDNLSGATLSGTCPIYDNVGFQAGSAFVSFL